MKIKKRYNELRLNISGVYILNTSLYFYDLCYKNVMLDGGNVRGGMPRYRMFYGAGVNAKSFCFLTLGSAPKQYGNAL